MRVRFAPSPTGELHIGGARTALYNYLLAKKEGGDFIIRIEDTDAARYVEGSVERILEGLRWLGITWSEGPDCGGAYAPYTQSERLATYASYAHELLEKGMAYRCFCTPERLAEVREKQSAAKQAPRYDRHCLALPKAEIQSKLASGIPHTIRLLVPEGSTTFTDGIRGTITIDHSTVDDQVLMKSDGYPTYHLANVVDDHAMAITHVVRGEEWLPSTVKHFLLYQAFSWEPPIFAHLSNILNERKVKLSKRKDGEAVWLQTYEKLGYLPQAMVNFLALLGWHPSNDRELYTLGELEQIFDLNRVQKAGAIFNLTKLNWFNAEYLKQLPLQELDSMLKSRYLALAKEYGREVPDTIALTKLLVPRLTTLNDVSSHGAWFFKSRWEVPVSILVAAQSSRQASQQGLRAAETALREIGDWTAEELNRALEKALSQSGLARSDVLWPIRVALTGEKQSPDAVSSALVLGREESLRRIALALIQFA